MSSLVLDESYRAHDPYGRPISGGPESAGGEGGGGSASSPSPSLASVLSLAAEDAVATSPTAGTWAAVAAGHWPGGGGRPVRALIPGEWPRFDHGPGSGDDVAGRSVDDSLDTDTDTALELGFGLVSRGRGGEHRGYWNTYIGD